MTGMEKTIWLLAVKRTYGAGFSCVGSDHGGAVPETAPMLVSGLHGNEGQEGGPLSSEDIGFLMDL